MRREVVPAQAVGTANGRMDLVGIKFQECFKKRRFQEGRRPGMV